MRILRRDANKLFGVLFVSVLVVSAVALCACTTKAISDARLDDFAANNIMFYDPGNSGGGCASADVSGTVMTEKIWNGLKSLGVTDEVAAGIMGNMKHEGGFSPARHETSMYKKHWPMALDGNTELSYGIGLIQWSFGRRVNVYNYIKEHSDGLEELFLNHPETYGTMGGDKFLEVAQANGVEAQADTLLSLELEYLINVEMPNSPKKYALVFKETTVAGAAQTFSVKVEGCKKCTDINGSSVKNRIAAAEGYYELYHGTGGDGSGVTCGDDEGSTGGDDDGTGDDGDDGGNPGGGQDPGDSGYTPDDYNYTGDVESLHTLVGKWAWHKPQSDANKLTPTADYKAYRNSGKPRCGSCSGADCGGFVYGVMRVSGWDTDFPGCPVKNMQVGLYKSDKWMDVTDYVEQHGYNSAMKAGDVLICSTKANYPYTREKCKNGKEGHVMLWVGEMSDFSSNIASASWCSRMPSASTIQKSRSIKDQINKDYIVFRKVK